MGWREQSIVQMREQRLKRVYCTNKVTSHLHLCWAFQLTKSVGLFFFSESLPTALWGRWFLVLPMGKLRFPETMGTEGTRLSPIQTQVSDSRSPSLLLRTYSVKHPVQQSGDHRKDSGLKCLEVVHKQPDISLEKSDFSSMTQHYTLGQETKITSASQQALHNIYTDTQGFSLSILDQFPESLKFLHVGIFSKSVLTFPSHCTTWKCSISLDHPEDKGAG